MGSYSHVILYVAIPISIAGTAEPANIILLGIK